MIKFFGKNNDLRTEEGVITKTGYVVMLLSSVFGLCVFLTGRYLYGTFFFSKSPWYQTISRIAAQPGGTFLFPVEPFCIKGSALLSSSRDVTVQI